MDNRKTDFVIQAALLDKYIHMENPAEDPIGTSVVIKKLKNSHDLQRYFFGQNPSAGWAQILLDEGFYEEPPNVVHVERGYQTPFWLQSHYLVSVAGKVPSVVKKIVTTIETDNPVIHEDLVKSLIKLPVSEIVGFTAKIKLWLSNEYAWNWGLAEASLSLIILLAENGFTSDAVNLLDELIKPAPTDARQYDKEYWGGEARARQDFDYLKPSIWEEVIPLLKKTAFPELIRILEKNLLESIRLELQAQHKEINFSLWPSFGWRSSIADSDQNASDYKNQILVQLRDALSTQVQTAPEQLGAIVRQYLDGEKIILRKIGLFIIAQDPTFFMDLVVQELQIDAFHDDLRFHNDYFVLLAQGFPVLDSHDQTAILKIIHTGPTGDESESVKEIAQNIGISPEEYLERQRDYWMRDRLWVIKESLPETSANILRALVTKYGPPYHPGFLSWVSEGGADWIRDVSPLPAEDLSQKTAAQFFEFIRSWKAVPNPEYTSERVSIEGLATVVADIILTSPAKYEDVIPKLSEVHPAISTTLFRSASEKVKKGESVAWKTLVDLIRGCSESNYDQSQISLENNVAARIEAMRLVLAGLSKETSKVSQIPDTLLNETEEVILLYQKDTSPSITEDRPGEGMFGHDDPVTVALNSVRPMAFAAYIEIQYRRLSGINGPDVISTIRDRIRNVLDNKLDRTNESSWAVHSIFGKYYWLLAKLDSDWLNNNISRIFPLDESETSKHYFTAAWQSYVLHTIPALATIRFLVNQYRESINDISKINTKDTWLDFPSRLFRHVFLEYIWNPYDLANPESLLHYFFKSCNGSIRGRAIITACNIFKGMSSADKKEKWPAIRDFWQWRVNEHALTQYPTEFKEEIESFSVLPSLAPSSETLEELWPLLQYFMHNLTEYRVWHNLQQFLAARVEKEPVFTAKYYRLMHEARALQHTPSYALYKEESTKILMTTLENEQSKRDALITIDIIFRTTGDENFKKLYEEHT